MRQIKFRAYNLKDKGLCFNPMQEINIDGEFDFDICGKLAYSYNLFQAVKSDDVVVMQYTGLKDKNGVEIYEGDVVEHERSGPCKVVYDITEFLLIAIKNNQRCCLRGEFNTIIGNIYENSELLESNNE